MQHTGDQDHIIATGKGGGPVTAHLSALRADQRLAEIEFKRSADLLPKKAVSRSDYDQAKAKLQSAQARVEEQQGQARTVFPEATNCQVDYTDTTNEEIFVNRAKAWTQNVIRVRSSVTFSVTLRSSPLSHSRHCASASSPFMTATLAIAIRRSVGSRSRKRSSALT